MTVERRLRILSVGNEAKRMNTAVKVAFATSNLKQVDQHFGAAESFAIYAIDPEQANLIEVIQFGQLDMDGNEDKLAAKIDALQGCIAIYCQAIGASAVNQLRPKGIQPVKVSAGMLLNEAIRALQAEMREGPSAWLARAIESQQSGHQTPFRYHGGRGMERMIEEGATVVDVAEGFVWVETRRRSACGHCDSAETCGTSALAKLFGERRNRLRIDDPVGLRTGDQVVIGIANGALVRASLTAYLLPLIVLVTAAGIGTALQLAEGAVALLGLAGLGSGLWLGGRLTGGVSRARTVSPEADAPGWRACRHPFPGEIHSLIEA